MADSELNHPLTGSEWRVDDIVGRAILEIGPATLRFEEGGRVSGRTGCNVFSATVSGDGEAIRFSELATTKMVCPPALMEQEQRFVLALESARGYSIDDDGRLHLRGEYEPFLLSASPR